MLRCAVLLCSLTGCTLYFGDSSTASDGDDGSSGSGSGMGSGSGTAPIDDPTPACASGLASNRWVVFDADNVDFNRDIYRMRPDGTAVERLTTDASIDKEPAPSPDGHTVAFSSNRSGSFQIYLLDLANNSVTQVTHNWIDAEEPSFSNDGRLIAFRRGTAVYTIHVDGTNDTFVTATGLDSFNCYFTPRFSADDTELFFDRNNELDAFDLEGRAFRYIVNNWTTSIKSPTVSPSGTVVAYATYCTTSEIWVTPAQVATDPCKGRRITAPDTAFESKRPAWGPDNIIAYERVNSANIAQIALISTEPGSTPCLASTGPYDHRDPAWLVEP